ncbi:Glycine--tRNA ligase beta subunit [Buchnera aphidicola (Neophyllaphis podocarpi)]|uniref:glycine--tRNA ligase subunit beta n=1 Tax=Buchnera aphidicola TaxID=9 RepID=UPI0034646950
MVINNTLLIEIGTEDLPGKKLNKIILSFVEQIKIFSRKNNIKFDKLYWFATPRRIAIKLKNIKKKNKNKKEDNIESKIKIIIEKSLISIKTTKLMYWNCRKYKFIRPIRNILICLNKKIIKTKIFGLKSTNTVNGHVLMNKNKIKIQNTDEYPNILIKKGNVIVESKIRRKIIKRGIKKIIKNIKGKIKIDHNLLEEITSIVEWPVVLVGNFQEKFLKIPKEILVCIIKNYQKCFPVYNKNNNLMPYFIFVIDIKSTNNEKIVKDNENVIKSRLIDALLFLKEDLKIKLKNYVNNLNNILFHKRLGSMYDKTIRIIKISSWIAKNIKINLKDTIKTAKLSKFDLVTNMVFEFPETQGITGMQYALYNKEKKEIALAIKEHYYPSFSKDKIPSNKIGSAISIADKIDTIVGMFYVGNIPKSNKDPFAIRRSTIGIIRIIISYKLNIDLLKIIKKSIELYSNNKPNEKLQIKIFNFIMERLKYKYIKKGYNLKDILKIIKLKKNKLYEIDLKIKAINKFNKLEKSKILFENYRRINKIIIKFDKNTNDKTINTMLFKFKEERHLEKFIKHIKIKISKMKINNLYYEILIELLKINKYVNNFFKKVLVNDVDKKLKINRINLLIKTKKVLETIGKIL